MDEIGRQREINALALFGANGEGDVAVLLRVQLKTGQQYGLLSQRQRFGCAFVPRVLGP